jgi:hypothetical protein
MCYSDVPGPDLVNTLNLSVTDSSNPVQTRYGNTNSPTVADNKNNVQKIIWDGMQEGKAELVIECKAIRMPAFPKQDFALAWSIEYVLHVSEGEGVLIAALGAAVAGAIIGILVAEHH